MRNRADSFAHSQLAGVVDRNIRALLERRRQEERRTSRQNALADAVTRFVGSMWFVYLHLILVGLWIAINLGWLPLPRFDPTFVVLAMAASVEAIFLSTFVLISQNRMAAVSEKRADLDLQISLLAEHEITRALQILSAIADRLQVPVSDHAEIQELSKDVEPGAVLERMDVHERAFGRDTSDQSS